MSAMPPTDRRQHVRRPLAVSVQFHHAPSRREYPGRCVDVSEGGMLMYVPAATPVKAGHAIRVAIPPTSPGQTDNGYQPVEATVVRVDRHAMLSMGHLAVGVKFVGKGK